MTPSTTCPKCSGHMEDGFVLDQTHGASLQSRWVEGPPITSFWTGLKLKGKECLPVATFRCERCGFLESYAAPA